MNAKTQVHESPMSGLSKKFLWISWSYLLKTRQDKTSLFVQNRWIKVHSLFKNVLVCSKLAIVQRRNRCCFSLSLLLLWLHHHCREKANSRKNNTWIMFVCFVCLFIQTTWGVFHVCLYEKVGRWSMEELPLLFLIFAASMATSSLQKESWVGQNFHEYDCFFFVCLFVCFKSAKFGIY